MKKRDDFSLKTKRSLEARAGNCCSFPGCSTVTVGPSDESEVAVSKTGMACHIAAAAGGPGARRYVAAMSKKDRTSVKNGIWMCYTHGRLIDTDEHHFTIPMLNKWREFAEFRAKFRQEFGPDIRLPRGKLVEIGFANGTNGTLSFSSWGNETTLIGRTLRDTCVHLVWGAKLCHAVRDVLVEILRNTFIHAKASTCEITVEKRAIRINDDGSDFNWLRLPINTDGRGGAAAVKALFDSFGNKLLLGSKRIGDRNESIIALAHSRQMWRSESFLREISGEFRQSLSQLQVIWNEMPLEWQEVDCGLSFAQIEALLWKFDREPDTYWSRI